MFARHKHVLKFYAIYAICASSKQASIDSVGTYVSLAKYNVIQPMAYKVYFSGDSLIPQHENVTYISFDAIPNIIYTALLIIYKKTYVPSQNQFNSNFIVKNAWIAKHLVVSWWSLIDNSVPLRRTSVFQQAMITTPNTRLHGPRTCFNATAVSPDTGLTLIQIRGPLNILFIMGMIMLVRQHYM